MVEGGIMMAAEALDKRLDRFSDFLHHQKKETTSGMFFPVHVSIQYRQAVIRGHPKSKEAPELCSQSYIRKQQLDGQCNTSSSLWRPSERESDQTGSWQETSSHSGISLLIFSPVMTIIISDSQIWSDSLGLQATMLGCFKKAHLPAYRFVSSRGSSSAACFPTLCQTQYRSKVDPLHRWMNGSMG